MNTILATQIIQTFETFLTKIQKTLDESVQQAKENHLYIMDKLWEIEQKTIHHSDLLKANEKMFKACHVGFVQVRDACTCLREELGEAAGTMVMNSWAD